MGIIFFEYGIFLGLLGLLFWISYLYYKTEKIHFILMCLLILLGIFLYYSHIFPFLFDGPWNATGYILIILFGIITAIIITLSFFKNKFFVYYFLIGFLICALFLSLITFNNLYNIKQMDVYRLLAKKIINTSGEVAPKLKKDFIKLSDKVKKYPGRYDLIDNYYTEEAKKIVGLYDFEHCQKNKSDECYLKFIEHIILEDTYKNKDISKTYHDLIKEYGTSIRHEIIMSGLEKELRKDIIKTLESKKNMLANLLKTRYNLFIAEKKVPLDLFLKEGKGGVRISKYNYFSGLEKKDIGLKRSIIDKKIGRFENTFGFNLKNILYTKNKNQGKYNDMEDIYLDINKNTFIISYNNFNNELYLKGKINLEKYLKISNYKEKYFNDLLLLYYFLSNKN